MESDFVKIIMNPVRQRIVQFFILHGTGTTGEIKQELNDVPVASLYRHVKILFEAGCIEVAEEKKIRGTVEKVYRLVPNPLGDMEQQDVCALIQTSLLSLMGTFAQYFAKEGADPQKDMLSLSTSTMLLTDEEYVEMTQKLGEIFNAMIYNQPKEGRKPRRITFISSPCEEDV